MQEINVNYDVIKRLIQEKITISAMESCTGGFFASVITDCSGASDIFPGSFVTYSNASKEKAGVSYHIIEKYGVYSLETAQEMAKASSEYYKTMIGVGITGSLGRKDPNNSDSVSGQVFYAVKYNEKLISQKIELDSALQDRNSMKKYVVNKVLDSILQILS